MRALPKHFSPKLTDLVQVLLRPVPDRRPSAETLIQCAKLEKEVNLILLLFMKKAVFHYQVKIYLAYVNGMIKEKEAARVRLASVKAEEEKMLEEVEKSIKENLEEETGEEEEAEKDGMVEEIVEDMDIDNVEKGKEEVVKEENSVKIRDRVGSLESGYGSGKVEAAQQTSL